MKKNNNRNLNGFKSDNTPATRKWGVATFISACIMLILLFYVCYFSPENMARGTGIWLTGLTGVFCLIWIICSAVFIYRITAEHLNAKINKKNNRIKNILALIAVLVITACTTSKSTISNSVNLSKYEYASIINNDTYHIPAELMEYEIMLYDAVEDSHLQLISDARIYELSPSQQEKLLMVKYGVNVKEEETIVTVNFIDYLSGRPVASCRGAYSTLGIAGASHDIKGAIKRVAKQISETFKK